MDDREISNANAIAHPGECAFARTTHSHVRRAGLFAMHERAYHAQYPGDATMPAATPVKTIRSHQAGGVLWITIDNPTRLNALTSAMWQGVTDAVRSGNADDGVRVIVLRGAGEKAFTAGADISEFETARSGDAAKDYDVINDTCFQTLMACPKPTMAMIHGYCFGGGLELAACCDLRLASEGATFSVPAAKLGLGYNARWIRPMLASLSPARAKEMLFTGQRYTVEEALQIGFLNRIVAAADLEAATTKIAQEIAANAPLTIRAAKMCVDEFLYRPEAVDMAALDAAVDACFTSADYAEGRRAFMEKRKPKFTGR
jgi:enoyl-CoA hydratase